MEAVLDIPARRAQAQRLYFQLALFVAENFEHMHIEEIEHNAVLWSAFSDEELLDIEGCIVASIPPAESTRLMAWMLPNIEHSARVQLLAVAQQFAPRDVFEGLLALARAQLGTRVASKDFNCGASSVDGSENTTASLPLARSRLRQTRLRRCPAVMLPSTWARSKPGSDADQPYCLLRILAARAG
jgi:hypothetical protein